MSQSPPKVGFGPVRRNESAGQSQVEVRFGWQVVGHLCRWHNDFLKHGWFFETNFVLARAVLDFGFPPRRVDLADAKAALLDRAKAHGLG